MCSRESAAFDVRWGELCPDIHQSNKGLREMILDSGKKGLGKAIGFKE